MISFIVIGRNEEKHLNKCLWSIHNTITCNSIKKYEIIYVDSNSSDNSIKIANRIPQVRIFKITGYYNAAIARNIGANESLGEILYFIDGDMEIIPEFLRNVFDEKLNLKYNFVSGQLEDHIYDNNDCLIGKKFHCKNVLQEERFLAVTGGLFIIKREIWFSIRGMNTKFRRSQDQDFGLRLAKKGILLLRKKELMAIHHTINYNSKLILKETLLKGDNLYGRSVLYRDHIFNKYMYKRIPKSDPTIIILLLLATSAILFQKPILLSLYLLSIIIAPIVKFGKNISLILYRIPYQIIRDISVIFAFIFYYPKSIKKYQYKKIK
ncbi:MAG: glycosyltransferase [Candidatus Cloacimonetes bacterium]|nr:glycosyltransferase [Candidatus Cloacimonadota bacterium]